MFTSINQKLTGTIYKGRRLLIIATTSIRPMLTETQLTEVFDAELRVPPISKLRSLEHVLREVDLFPTDEELSHAIFQLRKVGFGDDEMETSRLNIGIKKLLSVIEMSRQEPEAIAERLTTGLMGLGM